MTHRVALRILIVLLQIMTHRISSKIPAYIILEMLKSVINTDPEYD